MKVGLSVQPNKLLTKEVASVLAKRVSTTGSLCGKYDKTIDIQVKDDVTGEMITKTLSTHTVRKWIALNTSIIGTSRGFGDFIEGARNDYRLAKKTLEDKELLHRARRNAKEMLDMDITSDGGFIGITSRRDPKTGKRMETTRYKQKFIGTDPIKLKIKADQTMKVLEKLDPAFKKESETTNNVSITLSFLTIADKEQEMIKLGKIKTV